MDVPKNVHLYIAYNEKKLYITAGGAPATPATPNAPVADPTGH